LCLGKFGVNRVNRNSFKPGFIEKEMKFSAIEKRDLFYAGLMISLAFAILLSGGFNGLFNLNAGFLVVFLVALLTAGLGFVLHELAHKIVAQRYRLWAEFRASYGMLWLALLFSLAGFIIAAPGAVWIRGMNITRERNGKISLAGPVTNIVLAVLFLLLLLVSSKGVVGLIASFGLTINSLLAVFNMIPVMPFDGAKIIAWDKTVFVVTAVIAAGLYVSSFFL
jgi:Zn-dependent protease